jgi:DNA-binding GntR family transcriptional regulator
MIPNIFLDSSKICIKSILADESQAKILKIDVGEPLLFWERVTLTEDKKVIEISKFFTRGDKYSYYLEFHKNKNVKNILTNNIS